MSHTVTIDLVIKDLPALKSACKELGLEFLENKTTYHVFGKDQTPDGGSKGYAKAEKQPKQQPRHSPYAAEPQVGLGKRKMIL